MAMTVENGVYQLPINISSNGTVNKTLKTADTYVDKDIKIAITTPDAEFEVKKSASVTATASTDDTTYTSDTTTPYAITIKADAEAGAVSIGTKTAGYTDTSDVTEIAKANATTDSKTIYVKQGSLQKIDGSVAVESDGKIDLGSKLNAAPESGYYIKATSDGSVGVATAGWLASDTTAVDTDAEAYYTIASASLGNAETTGATYSTGTAPILVSGKGLYINEGYIENTYIPLATLVPDEATVVAGTDGNSNLIYNTVSVYDKDGTLIAGTMGDATLGEITASNVKSDITTLAVTAKADSSAFDVTASGDISGDSSVSVATTGYATTALSKTGSITGTASVSATLNKVGVGGEATDSNVEVTPVIEKNSATTATASGAITTSKPESGHYIAVDTTAIEATAEVTPKVTTEGYGTTSVYDTTAVTVKAGAAASGVYYISLTEADHSVTKGTSDIVAPTTTVTTDVTKGDVTPVTVSTKAEGVSYVAINASATTSDGSVQTSAKCSSTEGYITASDKDIITKETVTVADASASAVYIKVYDGTIVDG